MRKIIFFILFITATCFSQELPKLELTPEGVLPIIVKIENKSANQLYKDALNWVQETYNNPESVLKANIENEKIRINGFGKNVWYYDKFSMNMDYTIEISFKDGKYRFEFFVGQFYVNGGQKTLYDYTIFFKDDLNKKAKKVTEQAVPDIEKYMNLLSQLFYNYASGYTKQLDSDW